MKIKAVILIITLLTFLVRLYRVENPGSYYFDEYYSVYSASRWVAGDRSFYDFSKNSPDQNQGTYVRFHPPGGVLLTALGIKIFGDKPLGWRIASVFFGSGLVGASTLLVGMLTSDARVAILTAFLMSIENLTFFHSRVGTIDIFLVSLLAMAVWLSLGWEKKRTIFRGILVGLVWGLALAVKWSALVPFLLILGFIISRRLPFKRVLVGLGLVPVATYLLVFSLFLPRPLDHLGQIHQTILRFHLSDFARTGQGYVINREMARSWWEWPFVYRPVRYFWQAVVSPQGEFLRTVNVVPNLAIMFFLPLATGGALIFRRQFGKILKMDFTILTLVSWLFWAQWLVWIFSPRPTFIYYFLPAIPFGVMSLAGWLTLLWQKKKKVLVMGYLGLCLGFFLLNFPWLTALPVPYRLFEIINQDVPFFNLMGATIK